MAGEIVQADSLHMIAAHLVFDGREFVAACPTAMMAGRVAELVSRHGLIDVPDDVSAIGGAA